MTVTEDGQPFVEVHVATPNGISNRLLVPIEAPPPKADPPPPSPGAAPRLDPKTAKIGVSYQWAQVGPAEWRLEVSDDPDRDDQGILIAWDEGAGLPPAALQAKFLVQVDDAHAIEVPVLALRVAPGTYKVDRRHFVRLLLWQAQASVLAPRASFPAVVKASVLVRPDLREFSAEFRPVADPLEIDFANVARPVRTGADPRPGSHPAARARTPPRAGAGPEDVLRRPGRVRRPVRPRGGRADPAAPPRLDPVASLGRPLGRGGDAPRSEPGGARHLDAPGKARRRVGRGPAADLGEPDDRRRRPPRDRPEGEEGPSPPPLRPGQVVAAGTVGLVGPAQPAELRPGPRGAARPAVDSNRNR